MLTTYRRGAPSALPGSDRLYLNQELGKLERVTASITETLRGTVVNAKDDFGAKGDGVSDDTPHIQAFLQHCIDNPVSGYMPDGTYLCTTLDLFASSTSIPALHIYGAGMGRTILKQRDGTNLNFITGASPTTIASGGGLRNVHFSDFTIDGNAANQTANSWSFVFCHVKDFTVERIESKNAYGNALMVFELDSAGSGPGGIPALPAGQIYNHNVKVLSCVLDGTAQVAVGDFVVLSRIDGLVVRDTRITGARTSSLSLQFTKNFSVVNNDISQFWWGMYLETCQNGTISGNKLHDIGVPGLGYSSLGAAGIWLTSGILTYAGELYDGCWDVTVSDNDIYNIATPSGTGTPYGIRITGLSSPNVTKRLVLEGNRIVNVNGPAGVNSFGVLAEGETYQTCINGNVIDATKFGIHMGDDFLAYGGVAVGQIISGNSISNTDTGISFSSTGFSDRSVITDNVFINTATTAIDTTAHGANLVSTNNVP